MAPVKDCLLEEIIYLPEYEPVPNDPAQAIEYLSQWDCGECCRDPILLSELYGLHGHIYASGKYILFRSYSGDHYLYRRCA